MKIELMLMDMKLTVPFKFSRYSPEDGYVVYYDCEYLGVSYPQISLCYDTKSPKYYLENDEGETLGAIALRWKLVDGEICGQWHPSD